MRIRWHAWYMGPSQITNGELMLPNISGMTRDGQMNYAFVQDIRQVWPIVRPGID